MSEKSFVDLGLDQELVNHMVGLGFTTPTPIQAAVITPIIQNQDIFGQAETGTGKTGSFAFPIVHLLHHDPTIKEIELKAGTALFVILCPTRELAQQTFQVFSSLNYQNNLKMALTIGGEDFEGQKGLLDQGVHILIATPGRLIDLYKKKLLSLNECVGVVLDEADRLFDMGFKVDIHYILHKIPGARQIIALSATSNFEVLNTLYRFHSHPIEVNLSNDDVVVENLDHQILHLADKEKMAYLVGLLRQGIEGMVMIFCNTRIQTHVVATWLNNLNLKAKGLSGKMPQNQRTDLIEAFRRKEHTILVATDLAARGLDLDNVSLVINYDLPNEAPQYVHRVGRTARAGRQGKALSFCGTVDCEYLPAIEEYLKAKIPVGEINEQLLASDIGDRPRIRLEEVESDKPAETQEPVLSRYQMPGEAGGRHGKRDDRSRPPRDARERDDRGGRREQRSPREQQRENPRVERGEPRRTQPQRERPNLVLASSSHGPRGADRPAPVVEKKMTKEAHWKDFPKRLKVQAYSLESAQEIAKKHFKDIPVSQLESRILKEGKKRFWLFGPTKKTFLFFAKHNISQLIKNFLDYVINSSHLSIMYDISFKNPQSPIIRFFGQDEGLFTRNSGEMLEALDHLLLKYLSQVTEINSSFKLQLNCKNFNQDKEQRLISLAKKMREQVIKNKEAIVLAPMSPADRRVIHQFFSKDSEVKTESIGTGHYKQIKLVANS